LNVHLHFTRVFPRRFTGCSMVIIRFTSGSVDGRGPPFWQHKHRDRTASLFCFCSGLGGLGVLPGLLGILLPLLRRRLRLLGAQHVLPLFVGVTLGKPTVLETQTAGFTRFQRFHVDKSIGPVAAVAFCGVYFVAVGHVGECSLSLVTKDRINFYGQDNPKPYASAPF
jgi:hypothetical protein